jgi:hypothetical protein
MGAIPRAKQDTVTGVSQITRFQREYHIKWPKYTKTVRILISTCHWWAPCHFGPRGKIPPISGEMGLEIPMHLATLADFSIRRFLAVFDFTGYIFA